MKPEIKEIADGLSANPRKALILWEGVRSKKPWMDILIKRGNGYSFRTTCLPLINRKLLFLATDSTFNTETKEYTGKQYALTPLGQQVREYLKGAST